MIQAHGEVYSTITMRELRTCVTGGDSHGGAERKAPKPQKNLRGFLCRKLSGRRTKLWWSGQRLSGERRGWRRGGAFAFWGDRHLALKRSSACKHVPAGPSSSNQIPHVGGVWSVIWPHKVSFKISVLTTRFLPLGATEVSPRVVPLLCTAASCAAARVAAPPGLHPLTTV